MISVFLLRKFDWPVLFVCYRSDMLLISIENFHLYYKSKKLSLVHYTANKIQEFINGFIFLLVLWRNFGEIFVISICSRFLSYDKERQLPISCSYLLLLSVSICTNDNFIHAAYEARNSVRIPQSLLL